MSLSKRIVLGIVGLVLGACVFWKGADGLHRVWRLDTNPHAQARIENTWTTVGRQGGRYANLSFADFAGACLVEGVRLGGPGLEAEVGETIEIAPVPGSCAPPDLPSLARPKFALGIQLGVGLAVIALGMWRISGLPPVRAIT